METSYDTAENDRDIFDRVQHLCDAMNDSDCERVRNIFEYLGNRWALWSLGELGRTQAPLRFSQLQKRMDGVSHKVLATTLRMLENNNLLTRTIYPEVPPRVEYALTEVGRGLLAEALSLWVWIADHRREISGNR
jgi:DNA-binding HxlR family transcriptional regulator